MKAILKRTGAERAGFSHELTRSALHSRIALWAVALGLPLLASCSAPLRACGQENGPACPLPRIPSCEPNLIEKPVGHCSHPQCGREGERACTVAVRIPSCDDRLLEVRGMCVVKGVCGGDGQRACVPADGSARCRVDLTEDQNAQCSHPSCGRLGERACTFLERLVPCDQGLTQELGCTGDCRGSLGVCANLALPLTEPTANCTPLTATDPMRGFADTHVHMFAHLAFGRGVFVGAPYDAEGGISKALGPDYGTDLDLVSFLNTPIPVNHCPANVPQCGRNVLHGDHTPVDDTLGLGTNDSTRSYFGAPVFNGWPTWHSTTHQQVYYKWLERAWRGGLRLMTMLAVNNEAACGVSKHLRGMDCTQSMPGIDAQIAAARAFEQWLDVQPGGGWFKIVETPARAEEVIRSGKLAVVLGIEVDTLFNCKQQNNCTPTQVAANVDAYYALGVRHIFPTHDFDGGFAGTALFIPTLDLGNLAIEGKHFASEPCPGISDHLGCNKKGLTTKLGAALITKLMDKGMLVDIDHMSHKAIEQTFDLAHRHGDYPLMVGHGLFNELYAQARKRHERMRTKEQLATLRQLGGLVSVMTSDEIQSGLECLHSSRTFAQNYQYAVQQLQGPVAFGSDFNGLAPHVGPRFGDDACGKNIEQQAAEKTSPRLVYPFELPGFGRFDKQVTGQRTFDFNTDGLAHIGLLPDLVADLSNNGVDVEPLMHSAAAYVASWRKAEAAAKP